VSAPSPSRLPFRPHRHTGEDHLAGHTGIFGALNAEWLRLCGMPSTSHALTRWAHSEPDLRPSTTLQDLLDRIDHAGQAETDRILLALIRTAQAGQQLAAQVVLQAMLPKLCRIERTSRITGSDNRRVEDRRHITVTTFWEILAGYPTDRRTHRVAGNLALDTLHQLTTAERRRRPGTEIPVEPDEACRHAHHGQQCDDPTGSVGILTDDADILEVIAWGIEAAAITPDEAATLVRVYAPAPGEQGGAQAAADDLGLSPAAVRQRCCRARRNLINAVRDDGEGSPTAPPPPARIPSLRARTPSQRATAA
jgi:hypothetical protein